MIQNVVGVNGTEIQGCLANVLAQYRNELSEHPVRELCESNALPKNLAEDFAKIQYVDSTLWVAMLALAKGKVESPRLKEAIRKNILCEVGNDGVPHVMMCKSFVQSLGVVAEFGDYQDYAPMTAHSVSVMNVFDYASDGFIAGWLLVAESLVPDLFSMFRSVYRDYPNADLQYLDEHISVDADEHSQWMLEAAIEISMGSAHARQDVVSGMGLGARALLSVPDAIYAKAIGQLSTESLRGLAC